MKSIYKCDSLFKIPVLIFGNLFSEPDPEAKLDKDMKSVAEEDALRKLLTSDEEDEEENKSDESDKDDDEKKKKEKTKDENKEKKKPKNKGKDDKKGNFFKYLTNLRITIFTSFFLPKIPQAILVLIAVILRMIIKLKRRIIQNL